MLQDSYQTPFNQEQEELFKNQKIACQSNRKIKILCGFVLITLILGSLVFVCETNKFINSGYNLKNPQQDLIKQEESYLGQSNQQSQNKSQQNQSEGKNWEAFEAAFDKKKSCRYIQFLNNKTLKSNIDQNKSALLNQPIIAGYLYRYQFEIKFVYRGDIEIGITEDKMD